MNRSTSNSGGSSSGSGLAGGIVGSSVAPPAYGIPFMEQPHSVPTQSAPISQGDLHICLCLLCSASEPIMSDFATVNGLLLVCMCVSILQKQLWLGVAVVSFRSFHDAQFMR